MPSKAQYKANPDKFRTAALASYYCRLQADPEGTRGITQDEWEALFEKQGRCCAICGRDTPIGKTQWATDHDHVLGVVRGILCYRCNTGLGYFESPLFFQFFNYLARFE